MGGSDSKTHHLPEKNFQAQQKKEVPNFRAFKDKYESIDEIQDALKACGLESSNLIIGVDYTISNTSSGHNTFFGRSLHFLSNEMTNPYQQVISIVGRTLEVFDDDKLIPAYGFGDKTTQDKTVFSFSTNPDGMCRGFQEVLQRYNEITPQVKMAGPTSFAPLIRQAIQVVRNSGRGYHILIIIADGQVTPDGEFCNATNETRKAIVEASNYPLSIVMVGVGDGPWDTMEEFDDQLPERKFDNFQFVDFAKVMAGVKPQFQEVSFSIAALMEIPEQYQAIKSLRLLGEQ